MTFSDKVDIQTLTISKEEDHRSSHHYDQGNDYEKDDHSLDSERSLLFCTQPPE
jgi:hypothetical protein